MEMREYRCCTGSPVVRARIQRRDSESRQKGVRKSRIGVVGSAVAGRKVRWSDDWSGV